MTLAELLATNPSWPGSLTDQQALDWLKESVNEWVDVEWLEVQKWLHSEGITRGNLTTAAGGSGATSTAAQHFIDVIDGGQPLSTTDSDVRLIINASNLNAGAKASLTALAQRSVERLTLQNEYTGEQDDASWLYHIAQARV